VNAKTRAVASIEDAQRALDRALAEMDEIPSFDPHLVGFVVHTLNSYVNAMSATTELLQQNLSSYPDADVRTWLDGISHATDLMHHTIGRLLHSGEPSDFPLRPTYVNLTVMMDRACRYYRRLVQWTGIGIVWQPGAEVPLVWADRVALALVVDNLLSNALKASPQGSNVYVEVTAAQGEVVCSVKDEGRGLDGDEQARLLAQMMTGSGAATKPSTGFELAVAWEFVDRMGGRLWFESEPRRGTRFLFQLPARKERDSLM